MNRFLSLALVLLLIAGCTPATEVTARQSFLGSCNKAATAMLDITARRSEGKVDDTTYNTFRSHYDHIRTICRDLSTEEEARQKEMKVSEFLARAGVVSGVCYVGCE